MVCPGGKSTDQVAQGTSSRKPNKSRPGASVTVTGSPSTQAWKFSACEGASGGKGAPYPAPVVKGNQTSWVSVSPP
jgi:hypothetical protein